MTAKTNAGFWRLFNALPKDTQHVAREKFRLWQRDPFHPSLHFKEVGQGLWSARINLNYRTLARRRGDLVVWFWIGTHEEYDRLLG